MSEKTPTNRLAAASSPYLLQHAHNPVDWYPWGSEALEKAQREDKPILVSIGYSACHWCHVMERESFENEQVAEIMNEHLVCIKIDREERPDVDQIYMEAVHAMGQQGGWPLNVFLLPNQKPFYGGTYFPPANWVQLIEAVNRAFVDKREDLEKQAADLTQHIAKSELGRFAPKPSAVQLTQEEQDTMFANLYRTFDLEKGGTRRAPKFPMPSIWRSTLQYYHLTQNAKALEATTLTLDRMALGGIYDVVGGGFARYSVDDRWHIPHFEKMAYDNGQLLSLYATAYQLTHKQLYKDVVYDTVGWMEREMLSPEGAFFSALDADSEGVEGKFYSYTLDELHEALEAADVAYLRDHFDVKGIGNWEKGLNVFIRTKEDGTLAAELDKPEAEVRQYHRDLWAKLLAFRNLRVRPGLDDKVLTGWNGMLLRGLVDAYQAFGEDRFLELALGNAQFIEKHLRQGNQLFRTYKDGKANLMGYLEDYATVIDGYLALHQATFDATWLHRADSLAAYVQANFFDPEEGLFFYTDAQSESLIARKKELFDNVIPSSNALVANNLLTLGLLTDMQEYRDRAEQMMSTLKDMAIAHPKDLAHWVGLLVRMQTTPAEIAIVGPEAEEFRKQLARHYLPQVVVQGTQDTSDLPLLTDRTAVNGKTTVYVCYDRACQLPVHTIDEALSQIRQNSHQ